MVWTGIFRPLMWRNQTLATQTCTNTATQTNQRCSYISRTLDTFLKDSSVSILHNERQFVWGRNEAIHLKHENKTPLLRCHLSKTFSAVLLVWLFWPQLIGLLLPTMVRNEDSFWMRGEKSSWNIRNPGATIQALRNVSSAYCWNSWQLLRNHIVCESSTIL